MAAMPEPKANPLPLGIVGEAFVMGAALVWTVYDGVQRARSWWRRWPAPATLGVLTNDDIDRMPEAPAGRSC